MAKKKTPSPQKFLAKQHSRRTKLISAGVLALIFTLALGAVVGPFSNTLGAKKFRSLFASAPAPPSPPPPNLSKEYIYAGGRLIATEEPASGSGLPAPANLVANTLSNLTPAQVQISWTATPGADHYEVERTPNVSTNYTQIAGNVTGTTFTDTTVTSVTAYLYRVRAVATGGSVSPYSNLDVATAISFTDDTLTAGSTTVKAAHANELRQAVNAVRAVTTNLSAASWAETITASATPVRASHILELRTKLDEARSALQMPTCSYTSIAVGDPIQKVHFEQLRVCVK
jgi:hypothetical protein